MNLIKNQDINYHFNPFGGLDNYDNNFVFQPEINFKEISDLLNKNSAITIELVGRKGRGKTTHLRALSNYIENCEYIQLSTQNSFFSTNNENKIYIIDSIHHLAIAKRLSLWKQKDSSFIISTHVSKILEFIGTNRTYKSYKIGQNSKTDLKLLLQKRVALASNIEDYRKVDIDDSVLTNLARKHKSDKRTILNNLYNSFHK